MPITFACRVCRAAIVVNDGQAGHLVNCRKCKASCRVPGVPGPTTLDQGGARPAEDIQAVVPLAEPPLVEPVPEPARRKRPRKREDDADEGGRATSAGDIAFGVSVGIVLAIGLVCSGCVAVFFFGLYILKWIEEGGP